MVIVTNSQRTGRSHSVWCFEIGVTDILDEFHNVCSQLVREDSDRFAFATVIHSKQVYLADDFVSDRWIVARYLLPWTDHP
jgi:hypothetical protein